MKTSYAIAFFSLLAGSKAWAHTFADMNLPPEGTHLHMTVAGAYRSEALVKANERWTIPGTIMGGEALPYKAGLALDEALLTGIYRQGDTYAQIKFGQHSGRGEVELEHVLVGHQRQGLWAVEAGRMAAIFTVSNGEHASDTAFSNRRLVYDAFWGGQYNDQGIRVKSQFAGIDLGLELWSGERYPSAQKDSDKAAADIYARYNWKGESLKFQLGAFRYQGRAKSREDSRYAAGHNHSSAIISTDPTYFDGDVAVSGASAATTFTLSETLSLGAQGEVSAYAQDGKLWDATREAAFENRSQGLWAEAFARYAAEKISLRAERLKLENDISGAGASLLADKLRLVGIDKDPYRYSVSVEHFFSNSFRSRLEWTDDFSTKEKKSIITLSAVWNEMIVHPK